MEHISQQIARDLLSIKAVFFRPEEPFTWASGIKSPVYCDNRLTLTAPAVRSRVENALAETIRRMRDEDHCTILLVEHDMRLVMNICDRICAISFGQFLACGTPGEIQGNKLVQEAYLGEEEPE